GIKVYREFVEAIQRGEEPAEQLVHGVCLLGSGVLMLAPGFVSDMVAIALLVPPTRALIVNLVLRRSSAKVTVIRATHSGPIVEVKGHISSPKDVIDVDPHEGESKQ
ncbi:MAG: FxsA family protein, partial [Actinomycetes bacterium]